MTRSSHVSLLQAERFLSGAIKKLLQQDLRRCKMVKEADLESCVYYHLRRFLGRDRSWRIFARKYSKTIKRYPDLLLYKEGTPCIAIELKWMREKISRKDRKTLAACLDTLSVNKAYFICTALNPAHYKKLGKSKRSHEKYVLRERVIYLNLSDRRFANWKKTRAIYRAT